MSNLVEPIANGARDIAAGYGADTEPVGAYAALLGIYAVIFGAFYAAVESGKIRPRELKVADILFAGIATHKLTRILALDEVTSPIRAPFVRYRGEGTAPAELRESPRGRGMRRAIGTLLTCPWCLAPWIGGAMVGGLMFAPRFTRFICYAFTVAAISDGLNTAYSRTWNKNARQKP